MFMIRYLLLASLVAGENLGPAEDEGWLGCNTNCAQV